MNVSYPCPTVGHWLAVGLFYFLLVSPPLVDASSRLSVAPGESSLQAAIDAADPGDILVLQAGVFSGSVLVDRSITLLGRADSVIDAQGVGHVVTVDAPDVTIRGITLRNSGTILETEDSGIFVTASGDRALIENNRFEGNLIGVYLKGPEAAVVRGNTIVGSRFHRMNDRGNGVYLWNTPGSRVEDNDIRYGRDGIFVTTSQHNIFRNNRFRDLRFAIHYMYTHDSEIEGNYSSGNHVGYALMFSDRLRVSGNISSGDRDRGLFFNFTNYSTISDNTIRGGVEKCLFVYNANMNSFSGNQFEGCEIGIHFTAGSEQNKFFNNAFINNRTQVKYVGTRHIEWSSNGRGNYWSDNLAFDLDDDGIADKPYQPNDLVDQIVWRHPVAKLLLSSPAMQLLRWAQSEFPSLHPGGVMDSAPLMSPRHVAEVNIDE